MNISSFFIDRPIFASVISIIIVVSGLVAMPLLPVSEYPEIVPPTVVISGQYPGASPKTIAETVVTPLEQQINGVENAVYTNSSTTPDGAFTITVTFRLGTNLDTAQVQTQNRVNQAQTRLPQVVRQIGIVVQKRSPDLTMVVFLTSPDGRYDSLYLRNYAVIQVRDVLARLPGAGDVRVFGSGDYAMRLWLDPGKIAGRNMSVDDVLNAVREQNTEVAAGQIGGQPALPGTEFSYTINARGRLQTEEEFGSIIIKTGAIGEVVYLRDVARIELGPETYALRSMLDGKAAVGVPVFQLPGANALQLSDSVRKTMQELSLSFPEGVAYEVAYDPTVFVRSSISAVIDTLIEAVLLVVLVVVVFLQSWRASVVPLVAVPVAIVGTLAILLALGFSINSLTLFGLVLATGIVVDDAIVVVENVERKMSEGLAPLAAAHAAMAEVTRPIISIMLVLCSVFIPVAFVSGIEGQFYRQFAVTIAASTLISTLNSLTLSPALAALLLKPGHDRGDAFQRGIDRVLGGFFRGFNRVFGRMSHEYGRGVGVAIGRRRYVLAAFVLLLAGTWLMFRVVPGGFIPSQDKQYLIGVVQLPNAASLDRTEDVVRRMSEIAIATPGVSHAIGFPGLSANGFVSLDNAAVMFIPLDDFAEREDESMNAAAIAGTLQQKFASIGDAMILVVPPPPVQGLGTTGGFKLYVQDRAARGYDDLAKVVDEVLNEARQQPELFGLATYTTFQNSVPQLFADVDRVKAKSQGVLLSDIFGTLQSYLGSTYVNDFNRFGRTYRVYAQAEAQFRSSPEDVAELKARNANGEMVPLGSVANVQFATGPDRVAHYNVYLAADINSQAAPGYSSNQATAAMQRVLAKTLPNGYGYEWTELTYQQQSSADTATLVFGLCVLLVFLILSAQYESWSLPLAIILIVPMCLLSSMLGVWLVGSDNNILTQIGFIVLVGLACKNAILIVEFARERVESGTEVVAAAIEACQLRLRPILMTSFAFIMGVVPLVTASGAGSEMRHAMGIAVFAGMLGVTLFGLFLTPVFFVIIELFTRRKRIVQAAPAPAATGAQDHA
jgi:hydrophobe/amphiphile efflux-1 (HAE1) family protein